jgi:hypothetical protein
MRQISEKVKRIRRVQALQLAKDSDDKAELNADERKYAKILQQVQTEFQTGWNFMRPKIQEGLRRLKLYNNQLRDKDKVGDPLIYTIFQSIFSVLWIDRLDVEFSGREEGDDDMAENLNVLAEYDYDDMEKAEHDHDWIFDAMAFGRGLSYFNEFDFDTKTPIAEVWDPLTFIRDPNAKSVRGNRLGNGKLQYGYREVWKTREEMKDNTQYFNLGLLKRDSSTATQSLLFEAEQARNTAQGRQNQIQSAGGYKIRQGFTMIDGVFHLVELANQGNLLIRLEPLIERGKPLKFIPLIDRAFSPISHDWDGVNIFDILEDKQRFRAALINVIGEGARADVYPMRLFDKNKVPKELDKSYAMNKWLPVDGPIGDAVQSLQPAGYIQKAQFILDFLDTSAQKALATPEFQQAAMSSEKRTATEINLVSSKVETRYSLSARIFGLSEKRFWRRYYEIYDRDFEDIGKKSVRLTGAFGSKWRKFGREDIIVGSPLGLDIKIESRAISEATKQRTYLQLKDYYSFAFQYPDTDKLYGLRKLGRLFAKKDEIERLLPLNIDERKAREENDVLNENEPQAVLLEQDHIVHLREHAAAKDTPAAKVHIKAHTHALMIKRNQPELFPQLPSDMAMANENNNKLTAGKTPEGAMAMQ